MDVFPLVLGKKRKRGGEHWENFSRGGEGRRENYHPARMKKKTDWQKIRFQKRPLA